MCWEGVVGSSLALVQILGLWFGAGLGWGVERTATLQKKKLKSNQGPHNLVTHFKKYQNFQSTWGEQLVKRLTLGFDSGGDVRAGR